MTLLDFKKCPRCKNYTYIEEIDICDYCDQLDEYISEGENDEEVHEVSTREA